MTDTMEIPEILIRAEIFSDLSPDELALIASISTVREFRADEIIFEENSTGNELYVVADGEVDIRVDPTRIGEQPSGQQVVITTMRRGESFGEMALIDEGLRSATACSALYETRVIVIRRESLVRLCHQQPSLGYKLMRNLATDLVTKMRANDLQMREWRTWTSRVGLS
jgi:CRP-like cAMP-binding protein